MSIRPLGLTLPLVLAACGGSGDEKADDEVGYSSVGTESGTADSASESASESGSTDSGSETASSTDTTADTTADTTDTTASDTAETTSSDTTDTTDDTASETSMACQEFASDIAPIPPDVMFLLDRSGSMMEVDFDIQDPNKTRWQALYEAVEAVLGNGVDAVIPFGAKTFSTQGWGECGVSPFADVPIMLDNAALILSTIPGPLAVVNGGTPTNLGLEMTIEYMKQYEANGGAKFIIFITDGRIQCTNDEVQALADAVALVDDAYTNFGITTYVVGIALSNSAAMQIDGIAEVGGAPKMGLGGEDFYRADDAQTLADALAQVVEDSYGSSCLLNLIEPPFFPDFTKVVIGGQSFDLVDDCTTQDGFVYVDDTYSQIELCGAACEALGIDPMAEVQYYCDPG